MSEQIAKQAQEASTILKTLTDEERSTALHQIYEGLQASKVEILSANKLDMDLAIANKLSSSLIKRLDLSKGDKFDSMCQGILDVAALEDPLNKIDLATKLDDGLNLYRLTCPVGVLLIIFESRPEVIANISALAIKSGNAAILKGGKESLHTFQAMSKIINETIQAKTEVPENAVQLISTRDEVSDLLSQDKYIDLVIPRGSNELVRNIKANTKIPVLGHADGICSIYVDEFADLEKATKIIIDAKTNYPAGCNAVETVLINGKLVESGVHVGLLKELLNADITLHISSELMNLLPDDLQSCEKVLKAIDGDFDREFLSLDLAVTITKSVKDAIIHINSHSSKHTDAIITENKENAEVFLKGIDSAGVYWNCSTRFADGFRYGFGTEVGISTNKIHARGPVGLEGLVCYYYQMRGDGHIAGDYSGAGGVKVFKHEKIPKYI